MLLSAGRNPWVVLLSAGRNPWVVARFLLKCGAFGKKHCKVLPTQINRHTSESGTQIFAFFLMYTVCVCVYVYVYTYVCTLRIDETVRIMETAC